MAGMVAVCGAAIVYRRRPVEVEPFMQPGTPEGIARGFPPSSKVRVKPRFRGVSHRYAFIGALLPAALLIWLAPGGRATWASAIYAGSLVGLLGTSALYHGVTWSERARFWVGRVDLVMIFALIAGTYTPIAMLRLAPDVAPVVLTAVWGTALLGGIVKVIWRDPPKWASAAIYVSVGSVAIFFLPQVVAAIGPTATGLMLGGGVLYGLGALVYGAQRPDPLPEVFGYHEIFHLFVVAAASVHFAAIAIYVVPSS